MGVEARGGSYPEAGSRPHRRYRPLPGYAASQERLDCSSRPLGGVQLRWCSLRCAAGQDRSPEQLCPCRRLHRLTIELWCLTAPELLDNSIPCGGVPWISECGVPLVVTTSS